MKKDVVAVILAAGEGTRMKSATAKVLHTLCGRPMIDYVVDAVRATGIKKIGVVVSKKQDDLITHLKRQKDIRLIFQKKPLGTGDAVKSAKSLIGTQKNTVLVICADVPLIRPQTLKALIERHKESPATCTILTSLVENPFGLGRIVRDQFSKVQSITEENDATDTQRQIREINTGIYCFCAQDLAKAVAKLRINEKKGEYYLTDVVSYLYAEERRIDTCDCLDAREAMGINSRVQLSVANDTMRMRIMEDLMLSGVTITAPQNTFIDYGVTIGTDTTIRPFVYIEKNVKIGARCSMGPFCRVRSGSTIKDGTVVGNFSEINRSTIGKGSRMKHFGYLGDTTVGDNVNIGAGTVVANYDGSQKQHTTIRNDSFIGCDTVIIAPATIGKGVTTGAGSVVTRASTLKDHCTVVGVPARVLEKAPSRTKAKPKRKRKSRR